MAIPLKLGVAAALAPVALVAEATSAVALVVSRALIVHKAVCVVGHMAAGGAPEADKTDTVPDEPLYVTEVSTVAELAEHAEDIVAKLEEAAKAHSAEKGNAEE